MRDEEHKLQCAVVQHLKLLAAPGVYYCAIPNGGSRSVRTGARLKAEGVRAGAPDLLLIINGRAHGLELKTGTGRQSPAQRDAEAEWKAAGGFYAVAYGLDAALGALRLWGALRPDRNASSDRRAA